MAKIVLLSVFLGMLAIPISMARLKSGRRGLKWTLVLITLFNLLYLFAIRFIYPRLL
jgi:formate hydrogenlyase subunit 3/multisubunit Na+/H+ antiporter MnhD subunit